jgi:hypothetical protein
MRQRAASRNCCLHIQCRRMPFCQTIRRHTPEDSRSSHSRYTDIISWPDLCIVLLKHSDSWFSGCRCMNVHTLMLPRPQAIKHRHTPIWNPCTGPIYFSTQTFKQVETVSVCTFRFRLKNYLVKSGTDICLRSHWWIQFVVWVSVQHLVLYMKLNHTLSFFLSMAQHKRKKEKKLHMTWNIDLLKTLTFI